MSSKKERRKARKRSTRLRQEAWAAAEEGKLELARRVIRRAVEHGPGNARSWNEQGKILRLCGDQREALESFRRATRLAPAYAEAWANLAGLLAGEQRLDAAVHAQERAVELRPEDLEAAELLTRMRAELPQPEDLQLSSEQPAEPSGARSARHDWDAIEAALTEHGCCLVEGLLTRQECSALIALDAEPSRFEHEVSLGGRGGEAVYRFFRRPLPELVQELRSEIYWRVAPIANRWNELLGRERRYPLLHPLFLLDCRRAGQTRTTPLLFRYERGAANDFHRDLSGRIFFPLQLAITLGPGSSKDRGGAEFLLADVRPGKRRHVTELATGVGDAVLFCTHERLKKVGALWGLQPVWHGVKPLLAERRYSVGIPFHDYADHTTIVS